MNTILIVDPEEVARRALCAALRSDGCELIEAASGSEALALLKQRSVDLIITEYVMPEMSGLDLLRQALALRPDALRIMLVAHADLDVAVDAINTGTIYRFVSKPWDAFDLRVMIKLALRHQAALRETARLARLGR